MDGSEISQSSEPGGTPKRPFDFSALMGGLTEQSFSIVDILSMLRRRKAVIAACVALITTIGAAIVFQITPRYTAEASVILDTRKTEVVDVQAVLSGLTPDLSALRGEIEILKSPAIAAKVVQKLNLGAQPEFNPRLQAPSAFAPISDLAHWIVGRLLPTSATQQPIPPAPDGAADAQIQALAYRLLGHMEFTNDGRSYVIKISAESESPALAAAIANAYVDAYLDSQLEAKYDAVKRANDWLNGRLSELRQQVEASDNAVELYRAQHGLTATAQNGPTLTDQQLGELNSQLILATADRTQKETNLNQIEAELKAGGGAAASQVLASPLIQNLRQQETQLVQQEAQLATKYKPEHPAMINIKAQERDLEQKIKDEIDRVVQGMQGEVAAARARENSLRNSLQAMQQTSAEQSQAEIQLRELGRQAESNRTLYENFLNRFKQTGAEEDLQQADARLIAPARIPSTPSYPRTSLYLSLVFAASLAFGVIAAFGVEQLDNSFRTGEQIEKLAHTTPLGLAPDVGSGEDLPQNLVLSQPVSPYSESIRSIRTALRYSDVDNPPKVVLVTSSLPNEGKSVFSLSLARSVAYSGARALIIDCDLRRPSLANLLDVDAGSGILSLFDADADIASALRVDKTSGMHFITSTAGTANPQDLLGSKQLRGIIEKFRSSYDLIVLDTPPVLAVSDALILSHIADTTIFLARWGRTARQVVLGALKSFRQNGGNLAGVVLSRVDFRRHATYGYGDAGYYYGYYGRHYAGYQKEYGQS